MHRLIIIGVLASAGLFGGEMVRAGCGCGCASRTPAQAALGPGSYRFLDRQSNSWLYYDPNTRGTYYWSAADRRFYPARCSGCAAGPAANPAAPPTSSDGHSHPAATGPAHCPNCAAAQSPAPGALPPSVAGAEHLGHQHDSPAAAAAGPARLPAGTEVLPPPIQLAKPYGGQKLCPVTGDELGSMGEPIPVSVRGQTIWVCCRGCVAKVQRDPEKYLAKLRAERAAP